MKHLLSLCIVLVTALSVSAQHTLKLTVKAPGNTTLPGATVKIISLNKTAVADSSGLATFNDIPSGNYQVTVSFVGMEEEEYAVTVPQQTGIVPEITLKEAEEAEEEVTVISTRSNRSISNTPSRVQVLDRDEIQEEASMRPGDIRMMLAESTGIQAQPTSATSATTNLRIQGLDGRYTQILKDGFPVFSGAATGLGLLQTPPLDLRQVEIIKGSSSTLYGGGAIAGLVNLISKVPTAKRELNFLFNITSAGGIDINSFYGQRFKKTGITVFVSANKNKAYDPANISFTAIPKFERYTINPAVFFYFNDKTTLNIGLNTTFENRIGGDVEFINGRGNNIHNYFEKNLTKRLSGQMILDHRPNKETNIKLKNSLSYFDRGIRSKGYAFSGKQYTSFTEATVTKKIKKADLVAGLNFLTDRFTEENPVNNFNRNYQQATTGAFIQNTLNITNWCTLEAGLRGDYLKDYGFALLPRLSTLFKITPAFTTRVGGGLGYKPPTVFTEETERILYKNVLPVSAVSNSLEKSVGANWDINYRASFNRIRFSINQLFFYTSLNHPLFLTGAQNGFTRLENISGHIGTRGAETNIKLSYGELSLYLGYTYVNAKIYNKGTVSESPLTPKHRFNSALIYEIDGKWRFGSEIYYFSSQQRNDGSRGEDYWLTGFVAEKIWKRFSLFINFENFGDVRQTKFENINTGSVSDPVFRDIYAPLEGFIVNGGIKVRL